MWYEHKHTHTHTHTQYRTLSVWTHLYRWLPSWDIRTQITADRRNIRDHALHRGYDEFTSITGDVPCRRWSDRRASHARTQTSSRNSPHRFTRARARERLESAARSFARAHSRQIYTILRYLLILHWQIKRHACTSITHVALTHVSALLGFAVTRAFTLRLSLSFSLFREWNDNPFRSLLHERRDRRPRDESLRDIQVNRGTPDLLISNFCHHTADKRRADDVERTTLTIADNVCRNRKKKKLA